MLKNRYTIQTPKMNKNKIGQVRRQLSSYCLCESF